MARWSLGLMAGLAIGAALAAPLAAADEPKAPKQRPAQHGASHGANHGHGAAAAPAVPGPEIGFRGCAYFEEPGFAGRRGDMRDGGSAEWLGREWDNRISSVACASGCRMIGYADTNYGGARRNFTGAVAEAGAGWDDRISAARVVCRADEPAH